VVVGDPLTPPPGIPLPAGQIIWKADNDAKREWIEKNTDAILTGLGLGILLQRWDTPDRYERLRTKNYTSSKESVSSAKPAGHALTIVEYIGGHLQANGMKIYDQLSIEAKE
jgi:hypothetical protein